jgi:hypothetical protein
MHVRFIRTLLFAVVVLMMSAASFGQVGVAISVGPPALPVYEQPLCPGDGYLWTPGYWAYDYDVNDYYWVPGTWVMAPEAGFLWTPAYWGWGGDGFVFYDGYWGPNVGFYGGIDYGFGYYGVGFEGGRWDGGHFFYNRAMSNINANEMHNVYNAPVRYDSGVRDMSLQWRHRLNMRRQPEPIRSNALRRIWAGRERQRHRVLETLMTMPRCQPKRQARLILQPIVEEIRRAQATTPPEPARRFILATFRP